MLRPYITIDGKKYDQGTIFVMRKFDGVCYVEQRTSFIYYDTEHNRYHFLSPSTSDHVTCYRDTSFTNKLIRTDVATEKELRILQSYLNMVESRNRRTRINASSDSVQVLLLIAIVVLLTAVPPLGLVVLLCVIFIGQQHRR